MDVHDSLSPVRIGFGVVVALATAVGACSFVTDFGTLSSTYGKDSGSDAHHPPPKSDAGPYLPTPGEYHYTPLDGGDSIQLGTGGAVLPVPYSPLFFVDLIPTSDGCWDLILPLSNFHKHTYSFCNVDGGLAVLSEIDLFTAGSTTYEQSTCGTGSIYVAPNLTPDAHVAQQGCSGGVDAETTACNDGAPFGINVSESPKSYVFTGIENLTIAGDQVATLHFSQDRTVFISGVAGSYVQHEEWWFLPNGLPVQHKGHTSVLETPPNCNGLAVTFIQDNNWVAADLTSTPLADQ